MSEKIIQHEEYMEILNEDTGERRYLYPRVSLRREIVFLLGAVSALLMVWIFILGLDHLRAVAHDCDESKGRTCSIYELHQPR